MKRAIMSMAVFLFLIGLAICNGPGGEAASGEAIIKADTVIRISGRIPATRKEVRRRVLAPGHSFHGQNGQAERISLPGVATTRFIPAPPQDMK